MKLKTIFAVTVCAATLATGAASAKSAGFDSLDANDDGVLTQKELRSEFSRGFTRQLMQDDADKQLTREETIAAMGRIRESRASKEPNKPALRTRSGKKIAPKGALDLSNNGFREDFAKAVQENLDKGLSPAEAIAAAKEAASAAQQAAYDTAIAASGPSFAPGNNVNGVSQVDTNKELAEYSSKSLAAAKKAANSAQTVAKLSELNGNTTVASLADQATAHAKAAETYDAKLQEKAVSDPNGPTGITSHYGTDAYNSAAETYYSGVDAAGAANAAEKALEEAATPSS